MSITADRGLFARPPVRSGRVWSADAEALADAATREPAKAGPTEAKDDLKAGIAEVRTGPRGDVAASRQGVALPGQRMAAVADRTVVRAGGAGLSPAGPPLPAVRLVP